MLIHQHQVSKEAESHVQDASSELNRQLKHANNDLMIHLQNVKSEFDTAAKTAKKIARRTTGAKGCQFL
jgi:gas vesicle protein